MKHRVYGRHLGRNKNERTALFKNLIQSLFLNEEIQTTQSKANAIKGLVDKLINQAKSVQRKHLATQFFSSKKVTEKLVSDIAKRFSNRSSGYTSIIKLRDRLGDGARLVKMSLVASQKSKILETKK